DESRRRSNSELLTRRRRARAGCAGGSDPSDGAASGALALGVRGRASAGPSAGAASVVAAGAASVVAPAGSEGGAGAGVGGGAAAAAAVVAPAGAEAGAGAGGGAGGAVGAGAGAGAGAAVGAGAGAAGGAGAGGVAGAGFSSAKRSSNTLGPASAAGAVAADPDERGAEPPREVAGGISPGLRCAIDGFRLGAAGVGGFGGGGGDVAARGACASGRAVERPSSSTCFASAWRSSSPSSAGSTLMCTKPRTRVMPVSIRGAPSDSSGGRSPKAMRCTPSTVLSTNGSSSVP